MLLYLIKYCAATRKNCEEYLKTNHSEILRTKSINIFKDDRNIRIFKSERELILGQIEKI